MVGISDLSDEDKNALCDVFPSARKSQEDRDRFLQLIKERPEYALLPLTIQLARSEKTNSRLGWSAIVIACISLFIALIPVFHDILTASNYIESLQWIVSIGAAGVLMFIVFAAMKKIID
jgi:hypothetical protein